jgi:hypothetical protein
MPAADTYANVIKKTQIAADWAARGFSADGQMT